MSDAHPGMTNFCNDVCTGHAEAKKGFLHDWDQLAKPTIREKSTPIPIVGM